MLYVLQQTNKKPGSRESGFLLEGRILRLILSYRDAPGQLRPSRMTRFRMTLAKQVSFAFYKRNNLRLGHENKQVCFRDSRLAIISCCGGCS